MAVAQEQRQQVYVHVATKEPLVLERVEGTEVTPACVAPCDRWIDAQGEHRIGGAGIRPSGRFALRGGAVDVRVSPATPGGFATGIALTAVGFAAFVAADVASTVWFERDALSLSGDQSDRWLAAAVGATIVGAGLIIAGVPLIVRNARTRVEPLPATPPPQPPSSAPPSFTLPSPSPALPGSPGTPSPGASPSRDDDGAGLPARPLPIWAHRSAAGGPTITWPLVHFRF
jgi:hypothetical protein